MWVPTDTDWTTKPPAGTPLRTDGHWSVQGLVGCWLFNEGAGNTPTNLVDGTHPTTKSSGILLDKNGYTTPLVSDHIVVSPRNTTLAEFTFVSVVSNIFFAVRKTWADIVCLRSSNSNEEIVLETQVQGSTLIPAVYVINAVTGATQIENTAFVIGAKTKSTLVWTASASRNSVKLYADGLQIGTNTWGVNGDTHKCAYVTLGNRQSSLTDRGIEGAIYITDLLYNCALSPQKVASISANPYQVCQP